MNAQLDWQAEIRRIEDRDGHPLPEGSRQALRPFCEDGALSAWARVWRHGVDVTNEDPRT